MRAAALALAAAALLSPCAAFAQLLYFHEGNRLRRLDLETQRAAFPRQDVLVDARHVNGMICPLPDGSGRFVTGEDTGQPEVPPGWGVFEADGAQVGKLTATYRAQPGDPYGCAFDAGGRLFTTEVGNAGFGAPLGQLVQWFGPLDAERPGFCKLATDIGTATGIAIDAKGRVYVASASRFAIYRFSPPFPTAPDAAGGCGLRDETGAPRADEAHAQREVFARGLYTFSGLAFAPSGNLYAASVLTGEIVELDPLGRVVRELLDPPGLLPPFATGNPQGLALDGHGALYYADLDLVWDFPSLDAGPNGRIWRIRIDDAGTPSAPELLVEGLAFPDGLAVLPGSLGPLGPLGR